MQQENIPIKVGLLELLYGSQGTQFVIPDYQRNYTWMVNREVKQLDFPKMRRLSLKWILESNIWIEYKCLNKAL